VDGTSSDAAPPPRHVEDSPSTKVGGLKKRFSYSRGQLIETARQRSFHSLAYLSTLDLSIKCVVATVYTRAANRKFDLLSHYIDAFRNFIAYVSIKIMTVAALIGTNTTLNTPTEAFKKQVVNCAEREIFCDAGCLLGVLCQRLFDTRAKHAKALFSHHSLCGRIFKLKSPSNHLSAAAIHFEVHFQSSAHFRLCRIHLSPLLSKNRPYIFM
jgi:hypothetical protein